MRKLLRNLRYRPFTGMSSFITLFSVLFLKPKPTSTANPDAVVVQSVYTHCRKKLLSVYRQRDCPGMNPTPRFFRQVSSYPTPLSKKLRGNGNCRIFPNTVNARGTPTHIPRERKVPARWIAVCACGKISGRRRIEESL